MELRASNLVRNSLVLTESSSRSHWFSFSTKFRFPLLASKASRFNPFLLVPETLIIWQTKGESQ